MSTMKEMDAFERSVRTALDPYEVPYNSADWAQMEKQLDQGSRQGWQISAGLYALLFSGVLGVSSAIYLITREDLSVWSGKGAIALASPDEIDAGTRDGASEEPLVNTETIREMAMEHPEATHTPLGRAATGVEKAPTRTLKEASHSANVSTTSNTTTPSDIGGPVRPEVAIQPSVTEGCPGTTVDFAVSNMPEDGIHLWNFGDGSFSNKAAPTHTYTKPGTYEVTLSHSLRAGGNIHNKPASDLIVIYEAPEASFSYQKRDYENTIPSVHFDNRSVGGKQFQWDFGDGGSSAIAHPDHVFKKKGTYTVALTVSNSLGCIDRTERTVRIDEDYDLMAIKSFSPNGDGLDDTFMPEALRNLGVRFQFSIFDATTGAPIYETADAERGWNGRIGNKGDACAVGEYVWMVEMKDGEKLGGTYNGRVTLVH